MERLNVTREKEICDRICKEEEGNVKIGSLFLNGAIHYHYVVVVDKKTGWSDTLLSRLYL